MKYRVDIELGNLCSRLAYNYAKKTFKNRKNKIGKPLDIEGGFSNLIDFGSFYLCFNSDGIGSKVLVAHALGDYKTLGYDLVAMVSDDAVTVGAEPVALVNNLDLEKAEPKLVKDLMNGLEKASRVAGVSVAGGEIAEVPDLLRGISWNASLIGILEKDKIIDGKRISKDDKIIGLLTGNFRSNGFTLVRKVLEKKFGKNWYKRKYSNTKTWGKVVLSPSKIFTPFILDLIGRYKTKPMAKVTGIAHITGGGIFHNTARILPKGLKADFYGLPEPPEVFKKIIKLGNISKNEAYSTFNMGIGMVLITPEPGKVLKLAKRKNISARVIGEIR